MQKRKAFLLLWVIITVILLINGCSSNSRSIPPDIQDEFQPNDINKLRGFQLISHGDELVFVFDETTQGQTSPTSVQIAGTFNMWQLSSDWLMQHSSTEGVWLLSVPVQNVRVPGNSGQPEFKFVINGNTWLNSIEKPGFQFLENNLVLFPGDSVLKIITNENVAQTVKTLADFDLTNELDRHTLANFRRVPGTGKLFRSYHPFKKSKAALDTVTEDTRIAIVKDLMEQSNIKCIISLSGNELPDTSAGEALSPHTQNIFDQGQVLFINSSYNTVYYRSNLTPFAEQIKAIVEFIIDPTHPGPFMIHCRLGTDRTGVVSAVLAALCGASWEDIQFDYRKSNNVGMNEFRDVRLLQYSLENMLNNPINNQSNLKGEISSYLVNGGWLTQAQIDALVARLK